MTVYRVPPTIRQLDFVRDLQRKLRLTDPALDTHCRRKHGVPFADLDKYQVSALISAMESWKAVPADLQREMGQLDLIPPEVPS